jgi:hypothetical protein
MELALPVFLFGKNFYIGLKLSYIMERNFERMAAQG